MRIHAAMIVGPGEADRYLELVLRQASAWGDRLVVVADHTDQHTDEVLRRELVLGADEVEGNQVTLVDYRRRPSFREDESAVRNRLMEALDQRAERGDLVVVLDADEILLAPPVEDRDGAPLTVRALLEDLDDDRGHNAWSGTFYHLWSEDGAFYRRDGGWAPQPQFRVYRHDPGARIEHRTMACTAIPMDARPRAHSTLVFAHLGYQREADRVAKHARYMELDGGRFHNPAHLESIIGPPSLAPFTGGLDG